MSHLVRKQQPHDISRIPEDTNHSCQPNDFDKELVTQIEQGLSGNPKRLPSLLLWDERGHSLFQEICRSPHYSGTRGDGEVLAEHAKYFVSMLGKGGTIVELGAGSMPNTHIVLEELCRVGANVEYVAHDICGATITKHLSRTGERIDNAYPDHEVKLRTFVGTYEQSIDWLATKSKVNNQPLIVLWLGNSLSHYSTSAFITILDRLRAAVSQQRGALRRLIVSAAGYKDASVVQQNYDSPDGSSSAFVANALQHANRLLGRDLFQAQLWKPVLIPLRRGSGVAWCFRALQEQVLAIESRKITIHAHELLEVIRLRHRSEEEFSACLRCISAKLIDVWRHDGLDWNIYILDLAHF